MGKFGRDTIGDNYIAIENMQIGLVCIMDNVAGQQADSITVYMMCSLVIKKAKCALYDNQSPRRRVAVTEELNLVADNAYHWITFTFATPPALVANQEYLLAIWGSADTGVTRIRYDAYSPAMSVEYKTSQTYDTWPDPWHASPSTNSNDMSAYCTYSAVPSGNPYPVSQLKKGFISGYHCFINAFIRAKVEGFDPLKLPDGTPF